ncbi:uncharacterized protein [Macrobrachium rosenbergii]|uniref:uncharacterized protein isoform X2 n=1 Tax=Macrobrachium rosenbergii TaxID=79674 RepID=UPI0034D51D27
MNALAWLFFLMLPCIIQASRPPFVVSRQPRVTKMIPRDSNGLHPVVWVSPTFRFRRSLDVAKRSTDDESFRFRRNYNDILRYGRSLDLSTPCQDCEEEDKNLYAYSRAIIYPAAYSAISEDQGVESNESGNFMMESQPSETVSSSPAIVKRDVHRSKGAGNHYTTMSSKDVTSVEDNDVRDSGIDDSMGSF